MNRDRAISHINEHSGPWDVLIVGGGATGAACLLDAVSRGLSALLIERGDFGVGTSSRSTKLIHGGVRYLEQGSISLVKESLKERGQLRDNATSAVSVQEFVVPCYSLWEKLYYAAGLKTYDFLSGKFSFGKSSLLKSATAAKQLPGIKTEKLSGGISYFDGRFDDTDLLVRVLSTAVNLGGCAANYIEATEFERDENAKISGVKARCLETRNEYSIKAKTVINATGIFTDETRSKSKRDVQPLIEYSQGIHIVLDRSWLDTDTAMLIPKTRDKRVIFAIPFYGKVLVGTTDTKLERPTQTPRAVEEEIYFLLETLGEYMTKKPSRADIRSVFAGIRPLVKNPRTNNTASLSRGHFVEVDKNGLITITGGKWTTFRNMGEDAIDTAVEYGNINAGSSQTAELPINEPVDFDVRGLEQLLSERFPWTFGDVIRSTRFEMARTVEDVLARRTRLLFVDVAEAKKAAPTVAQLMASELGRDGAWIENQIESFNQTAKEFTV